MLLHKKSLNVAKAASTDESRYALGGALIECDGAVTATDGHILVAFTPHSIPDESEFPLIEGMGRSTTPLHPTILPAQDALMLAGGKKQNSRAGATAILEYLAIDTDYSNENGSLRVATTDLHNSKVQQIRTIEGTFPDYSQVLPDRDAERLHIGFTISVFRKLLDTLEAVGARTFDMQVPEEPLLPVRVDATSDLGTVRAVIMPARL